MSTPQCAINSESSRDSIGLSSHAFSGPARRDKSCCGVLGGLYKVPVAPGSLDLMLAFFFSHSRERILSERNVDYGTKIVIFLPPPMKENLIINQRLVCSSIGKCSSGKKSGTNRDR